MRTIAHISALRPAKDSVNWQAIPVGTPIVAGYVPPSRFAWPAAAWARFAGSIEVRITPSAAVAKLGVEVLDIESGDATPAQAPGWVRASRAAGQEGTCYCSISTWPSVIRAINAAGITQHPPYWVAGYPGGGPILPSITVDGVTYTATAHQYADPNSSGGDYDLSVVAPFWPGVDQGADMLLTDEITIPSGPNAGKVLADVNDTMYFTDLYAGQAATVVQDPNVGNAALAAQLKTLSTKLDTLTGNLGGAVQALQATETANQTALTALAAQVTQEEADLLSAIKANAAQIDPTALAAALEAGGFAANLVAALLAVLGKAANG